MNKFVMALGIALIIVGVIVASITAKVNPEVYGGYRDNSGTWHPYVGYDTINPYFIDVSSVFVY